MALPSKVKIVEVAPRDGLQNEKIILSLAQKINFIEALSQTGLSFIEVASFVSPKWIPQLADAEDLFLNLKPNASVTYSALVPNKKGLDRALKVGVKHIAIFTTPSERFSQHNTHCSVKESMQKILEVAEIAKAHHITLRAYLSCVLGCPYEGKIAPEKVANLAHELCQLGCTEISLGDTIGVGTPLQVQTLIDTVQQKVPLSQLAVHFHDTYGQALANIFSALQMGIAVIDSSVAGLGGCPYAKGASGNVATEDVIYMLNGMNIETGIDLNKLAKVGQSICRLLEKPMQSKVNQAL